MEVIFNAEDIDKSKPVVLTKKAGALEVLKKALIDKGVITAENLNTAESSLNV